jgi:hypothetical protein
VNLGASAIVLRPRTLAEVLDLACRVSMSLALGLYARLSLVLLLPIFAGCLALKYAAGWHWVAVFAVAALGGTLVQGVFTVGVGRLLFSEAVGARQALLLFGARLGAYLGMLFFSRALLLASALPFGFGLPFAWPRVFYAHEACLLEGAGPIDAIKRANRFVYDRVMATLGASLAILVTQAAMVVTTELLCQGLVSEVLQLGKPFGSLWPDAGSPYALAGLLLSFPYVATARFLLYIDGRTSSDGWDVQLKFMAIVMAEGERQEAAAT